MPLVGSSAYNTLGVVNTLVRSLVNDSAANWCTDALILPYANSAYRTVQRKLANTGSGLFITDDVLLVVPAVPANQQDPATQVVINDATAPPNQLPSNLLQPLKLWERRNGSSDDFTEMVDLSQAGGLPSRLQDQALGVWEWRTDGLYFIGATEDRQIRLRYEAALPDLTGSSDTILIRNAQEAIAYAVVPLIGGARGSTFVENMDNLFNDAMEDVIVANVKREQEVSRRRRPYGGRAGARYGRRIWDVP